MAEVGMNAPRMLASLAVSLVEMIQHPVHFQHLFVGIPLQNDLFDCIYNKYQKLLGIAHCESWTSLLALCTKNEFLCFLVDDLQNHVRCEMEVFKVAGVPIEWEENFVGKDIDPRTQSFLTWESLESVRNIKVGLKVPMATPVGKCHRSLNLTLSKKLNLYANVRPCYSLPGYKTKYDDVDLITIRENTEGEYSGLEHQVVRGVVESLKIITRQASLRVAEYAFHYAQTHERKRVSAIHKANIMQKTDGLFLKCCREVAEKYPDIVYEEVVIDNCCMMLVKNPASFDVLVMPNLYGDIISEIF
ncbi:3-isopropylmalate dehydrogenase, chloroplastic-like [Henckelia pumila]|uniref:3-isopropylmalate dehydrogenase, chloroplastic-like n=1 Tax=Henckelia pumila TaxID=405737 RepID=UPI003C6E2B20